MQLAPFEAPMNKIVRNHYPVAMLPDDLRDQVADAHEVRVTLERVDPPRGRPTIDQLRALRAEFAEASDDPVERIRKLRDEWDS